jgi:hypothetical protein
LFAGLLAILVLGTGPVFAYEIALKDGRVIKFEIYRVTEGSLLYINENGRQITVPLSDLDLDRTQQLNSQEAVPLVLPGAAPPSRRSPQTAAPSLADTAYL